MQTDICGVILALDPKAQVSVSAEDLDQIIWLDDNPNNITVDQIKTKQAEMVVEYNALAYSRNRKKEYDKLNQFELISDDSINGTTTHEDAIIAIKLKYPKQ